MVANRFFQILLAILIFSHVDLSLQADVQADVGATVPTIKAPKNVIDPTGNDVPWKKPKKSTREPPRRRQPHPSFGGLPKIVDADSANKTLRRRHPQGGMEGGLPSTLKGGGNKPGSDAGADSPTGGGLKAKLMSKFMGSKAGGSPDPSKDPSASGGLPKRDIMFDITSANKRLGRRHPQGGMGGVPSMLKGGGSKAGSDAGADSPAGGGLMAKFMSRFMGSKAGGNPEPKHEE